MIISLNLLLYPFKYRNGIIIKAYVFNSYSFHFNISNTKNIENEYLFYSW